jgi:hypothetical protein
MGTRTIYADDGIAYLPASSACKLWLCAGGECGHAYWVDKQAGFTTQDQSDLIQFLLSIDDDPEVLPDSAVVAKVAAVK